MSLLKVLILNNMGISLPKVRMINTKISVPKMSIPKLNFVTKPSIGYAKPTMSNVVKTKIKLK